MLQLWDIEPTIECMTVSKLSMNPFGERFWSDKRYKVTCIAGCGNSSRHQYFGRVGHVQFELNVDRIAGTCKCRLLEPNEYFTV